jgi:hypothetical protein
VQLLLQHRVADAGELGAGGAGFGFDALQLAARRGGGALVVVELGQALALGEAGLLGFAPELDFQRARLAQWPSFCRCRSSACSRRSRTSPRRSRCVRLRCLGTLAMRGQFGFFLALQFRQVAVDLRRALFEAGLRLGQLERLDLRRMEGLLRLLHGARRRAELALGVGQLLFDRALDFARRILGGGTRTSSTPASSSISRWRSITPWVLASGTYSVRPAGVSRWPARDTRWPAASGNSAARSSATATPASHSSSTPDQRASSQRTLLRRLSPAAAAPAAALPASASVRIAGGGEANAARTVHRHRPPAPRSVRAARPRPRFPSRLRPGSPATGAWRRPDRAPSAIRRSRRFGDLGLQLRQRVVAGAGFGQAAMRRLQGFAGGAQLRLGRGYGGLQRRQALLRHRQRASAPLASCDAAAGRLGRAQGLPVLLQAAAPLHQVFQRALRMALVGLGQAQRLFGFAQGAAGLGDFAPAPAPHPRIGQAGRGFLWRAAAVAHGLREFSSRVPARRVLGQLALLRHANVRPRRPADRGALPAARESRKWPISDSSRLTSLPAANISACAACRASEAE